MQDPSTPNHSDPGKSASDPDDSPKKPLKLKPIGKSQSDSDSTEPDKKAPEKPKLEARPAPKPVPTDSPPNAESRLEQQRKGLKLRRMVVKDADIKPRINPDAEPVPESQPFQEPDEAPPPVDMEAVMKAPIVEEAPAESPSVENEPVTEQKPPDPPVQETPSPQPQKQEAVPVEPPPADASEDKKVSPVRRVIAGLAFLSVFCLIALLGIAYFNPFGEDLAPIQPRDVPIVPREASSEDAPASDNPSQAATASAPDEIAQPDLQAYLDRLEAHRLIPSANPRGIFVDTVFIPEGAVLDPRIGLILSAVTESNDGTRVLLTSEDGSPVEITLTRKL